jgi:hypothetical protein
VKALTFFQPDAERVLRGMLRLDQRRTYDPYRGLLAVHAGSSQAWLNRFPVYGLELTPQTPFGALVGVVQLAAVFRPGQVDRVLSARPDLLWLLRERLEGPYCYLLLAPQRFVYPVPCRGQPGVWEIPAELESQIPLTVAADGSPPAGAPTHGGQLC